MDINFLQMAHAAVAHGHLKMHTIDALGSDYNLYFSI